MACVTFYQGQLTLCIRYWVEFHPVSFVCLYTCQILFLFGLSHHHIQSAVFQLLHHIFRCPGQGREVGCGVVWFLGCDGESDSLSIGARTTTLPDGPGQVLRPTQTSRDDKRVKGYRQKRGFCETVGGIFYGQVAWANIHFNLTHLFKHVQLSSHFCYFFRRYNRFII